MKVLSSNGSLDVNSSIVNTKTSNIMLRPTFKKTLFTSDLYDYDMYDDDTEILSSIETSSGYKVFIIFTEDEGDIGFGYHKIDPDGILTKYNGIVKYVADTRSTKAIYYKDDKIYILCYSNPTDGEFWKYLIIDVTDDTYTITGELTAPISGLISVDNNGIIHDGYLIQCSKMSYTNSTGSEYNVKPYLLYTKT